MSKCKCIEQLEKNLIGTEQKGGIVRKAELINAAFIGQDFEYRTISEVECEILIKDKPKKKIVNVIHSYCPFCGKKL